MYGYMAKNYLGYAQLLSDSTHSLIKKVVTYIMEHGLHDENHLFISFITHDPRVQLSQKLKDAYPEEITIVLQHQFKNLYVEKDYFCVQLSFDGVSEQLIVPFDAITSFIDPSVNFSLQFKQLKKLEAPTYASVNTIQKNSKSQKSSPTKIIKLKNFSKRIESD